MKQILLKPDEVAEITRFAERTIYDMVQKGEIKNYGDKKILIDKVEVLKKDYAVITLYNLKGGVLKSTIVRTLAWYFSTQKKYKTLSIDLDPQGNLTQGILTKDNYSMMTVHNFLDNNTPLEKIVQKVNEYLDLIPANLSLVKQNDLHIEELNDKVQADFSKLFKKYQIVLIDCPPNFTGMTRLGLLMANYIFIPVLPDADSFEGHSLATELMNNIVKYSSEFKKYYEIMGKIDNDMYSIDKSYLAAFEKLLKNKLLKNYYPEFYAVKETRHNRDNLFQKKYEGAKLEIVKNICEEVEQLIYEGA